VSNPGALEISDTDNVLEFAIPERMLADLQITSVMPNRMDIDAGEAFTYRIEIENVGQGDVSRITRVSMIDVASGAELAPARVSPIDRGGSITVTLDLISANGQTLRFLADSTSTIPELDEENNSFEISVLDVMTHDISIESLTVPDPINFVEITTSRRVIANNGPGIALNLNAHATIFHASGGSTALAVVVFSSLESGAMITGVTKYLPVAGDRFVITIETPDQVEVNDLDNTGEVLVDDLQA